MLHRKHAFATIHIRLIFIFIKTQFVRETDTVGLRSPETNR
jgi:hypothetical protein